MSGNLIKIIFVSEEYNRRVVKPKNKQELVWGIMEFWETVTVEKCRKYIKHLKKVLPKVIERGGGPTGYWCMYVLYLFLYKCLYDNNNNTYLSLYSNTWNNS